MLPTVDFCGLSVTRLIVGANPFGGFSHQNKQRDAAMRAFHTHDRILETWRRAETAGLNTFITNNESENVIQAVRAYRQAGGPLQWIAQVACHKDGDMFSAIDEVVRIGCRALYIHGAYVDDAFLRQDADTVRAWCRRAHAAGVPVGVAGHAPDAHRWVHTLDCADFHAVCGFNCGSLHAGQGEKFRLADLAPAYACIRDLPKPCIAYKIMGAGRLDARLAFDYAFSQIKPTDVVNVGMHRGDNDNMVEDNAAAVRDILTPANGIPSPRNSP